MNAECECRMQKRLPSRFILHSAFCIRVISTAAEVQVPAADDDRHRPARLDLPLDQRRHAQGAGRLDDQLGAVHRPLHGLEQDVVVDADDVADPLADDGEVAGADGQGARAVGDGVAAGRWSRSCRCGRTARRRCRPRARRRRRRCRGFSDVAASAIPESRSAAAERNDDRR